MELSLSVDPRARSASPASLGPRRAPRWLLPLGGALGVLACVALAWHTGLTVLSQGLSRVLPWLPLLVLLELLRPVCELMATGAVLDAYDARVRWRTRIRAQLLAHALDVVMPTGRLVAEASKATLLSAELGAHRAAAVGAAGQTLTLLSSAAWTLLGVAIASLGAAHGALLTATVVYSACTLVLATAIVAAALLPLRAGWLRRVPHVQECAGQVRALIHAPRRHLWRSALALWGGRVVQALQLTLLLGALGGAPSWVNGAVVSNLYVVSAAAGELIPAQLGVIDGAFAVSGAGLSLNAGAMLGLSLGLHAAQLMGAAISAALFALSGVVAETRSASCPSNA